MISVTIDGIEYRSIAEAARAIGVSYCKAHEMYSPVMQGPRNITIRGVTYPTCKAAAEAMGVSWQYISEARRRGILDGVGLRHGRRKAG